MTPNELMNNICDEADKQSQFYKDISNIAETRDKLKYITMLIEHFNCEFDCARTVVDHIIDGTPLPSNLSPQEQAYNNAVAQEWLNKPKCPTCNSTNIKKISGLSKAGSVAMFGIFSQKVKKQMHCNNCGYEW